MNKLRFLIFGILISLVSGTLVAQDISIANISSHEGYYDTNIEISGSGFGTNAANMEVWFGGVRAAIESVSENLIIVRVPLGAATSSITVRNKTTGLSATSSSIFHPTFQGPSNPDYNNLDVSLFSNAQQLSDLVIVDLDNDGKNDILASKIDGAANTVVAYRNTSSNQTISFVETNIPIGSPTLRLAYGDLDGDGKQDIVLSREGNTKSQIYILRNTSTVGSISFAPLVVRSLLNNSQAAKKVIIRDLNLDGKPEIIVANSFDGEISIFENNSTLGNLNIPNNPVSFNAGNASSNDIIVEDLDNNGKQDIAVTQFNSADIFILPNTSSSGSLQFATPVTVTVNGSLNNLAAGDIDEDEKIDLVATDILGNAIFTVINESTPNDIKFANGVSIAANAGSFGVALADINGNSHLDILVTSQSGTSFALFENNSTPGNLDLVKKDIPQTNRSINIATGDLNNDSKVDIAFTEQNSIGTEFYMVVARNNFCIDPFILGDPAPSICNGQTYRFLTAPAEQITYEWLKDGTPIPGSNNPYYDATTLGSYTVRITGETTCDNTSSPIALGSNTDTPPPNPVASNNGPACLAGSISLTASTVAGATYNWTGPNGFTSTEQNPTLTNVTAEMAGTYTVVAFVNPCNSAPATTIVEVINPPNTNVSLSGSNQICVGETVTLTAGLASGYNYQWFLNSVAITGATSNSYDAAEAGSYTVNLKGQSNSCDLTSDIVVIESFSPPTVEFDVSGTLCEGSTISFSDNSILEPGKTPTYSWDFGDLIGTSNEANPSYTYTAAATYSVELIIGYEGHSCLSLPATNDVIISAPTDFIIEVTGNIPFCEGDSVLLEVPNTGFTTATWSTSESGLSIYGKDAGTITATATNTAGCISSAEVILSTTPAPTISVTIDNQPINSTTISIGQSVQLEASGADSYRWNPSDGLDNPDIANPIAAPSVSTTYQVLGTALNGCSSSTELIINIEDTGDKLPIEAPKMFSPDNNGIDDEWVIGNIENFPECEIVIFSRNGKIVYQETGYLSDWRGIDINGNDLPEGAYFYTITCPDGKNASGSVSIIRQ